MGFVSTGQSLEFCPLYECHDECLKLAVASQLPCALARLALNLKASYTKCFVLSTWSRQMRKMCTEDSGLPINTSTVQPCMTRDQRQSASAEVIKH